MSDWGVQSKFFDEIKERVANKDLSLASEAQTRFDIIDEIIKKVFGWQLGQISVEERQGGVEKGYIDYILRGGDTTIIVEAKKIGATFPNPTEAKSLKFSSTILQQSEVRKAIEQVIKYSRTKTSQILAVTNGRCWCFFDILNKRTDKDKSIYLLFPFDTPGDAEELYNLFNEQSISNDGISKFIGKMPIIPDRKILNTLRDSELRMDRNRIADYISPALSNAMHSDSLLSNPEHLKRCFVSTESRIKFDSVLGMHLADTKPLSVAHVKRIKPSRQNGPFENIVKETEPNSAPPVTLLLAPVGTGKSTYLKHFELVAGVDVIDTKEALWIYIDFESMGKSGDPRKFLYERLKQYLTENSQVKKTDYRNAVEPAYHEEIEGLKNGPYAPIRNQKDEIDRKVSEHISSDYDKTEPYVDKILKYLSKKRLCVVVLDNIDLYEDEKLETEVFSEGLGLSKRVFCNVIVSLRDTTYMKHKDDSIFNAFQLKTFWLDPPPFKEVLRKRLSFSKILLKNKSAVIPLNNGANLRVSDLSLFFEIVQSSVLQGDAGNFVEIMAGINMRKGIKLITNFLTSGHINAERALKMYMASHSYTFPFHEIYKGTILGPWMYFKETRSECLNIFDSNLNSKNLRLLRFVLLSYLYLNSRMSKTPTVTVEKCVEIFSHLGANEGQIRSVLNDLLRGDLIKEMDAKSMSLSSVISMTRTGGYVFKLLSSKLVYVESCLHDTFIDDENLWSKLTELTYRIENENRILEKIRMRAERAELYVTHLQGLERKMLDLLKGHDNLTFMPNVLNELKKDVSYAVRSAQTGLNRTRS
jgi:hypothetical protein